MSKLFTESFKTDHYQVSVFVNGSRSCQYDKCFFTENSVVEYIKKILKEVKHCSVSVSKVQKTVLEFDENSEELNCV